jgi:hypothetical protein
MMIVGTPMDGASNDEAATDANPVTRHIKSATLKSDVNVTLTKLHQHCRQMRRNRSSAGPAVA